MGFRALLSIVLHTLRLRLIRKNRVLSYSWKKVGILNQDIICFKEITWYLIIIFADSLKCFGSLELTKNLLMEEFAKTSAVSFNIHKVNFVVT